MTGYLRDDGRKGVRNLVAVMAAADNVNPLVRQLAEHVPGVVPCGRAMDVVRWARTSSWRCAPWRVLPVIQMLPRALWFRSSQRAAPE